MNNKTPQQDAPRHTSTASAISITDATLGASTIRENDQAGFSAKLARPSSLLWIFGVGLLLIAGLAAASHWQSQILIGSQLQTARVINIAGRQRMLSVQIVLTTHRFVNAGPAERPALQQSLEELSSLFGQSHDALVNGSEALQLPGIQNEDILDLYSAETDGLHILVSQFLDDVNFLVHAEDTASDDIRLRLDRVDSIVPGILLNRLDDAVSALEEEARNSIAEISRREAIYFYLLLSAIAIEAFAVFIPLLVAMGRQFRIVADARKFESIAREQAESIFQNAPTGMLIVNSRGQVVAANPKARDLFLLNPTGKLDSDRAHLQVDSLLPDLKEQGLHFGRNVDDWHSVQNLNGVECMAVDQDGDNVPVEVYASQQNVLGDTITTIAVQNISNRKAAEKKLAEQERFFRTLYAETPIMLHSIDTSGKILNVSRFWLSHTGYSEDEVNGRQLSEFFTPDSAKYAETIGIEEFRKTGRVREIEYQIVTKSGEILDVLLSSDAAYDSDGNILYSFGVMTDVSAERRLQRELERSGVALEELHRITTSEKYDFHEKIDHLLRFGCDHFGLAIGIVSHITEDRYEVLHIHGPEGVPPPGTIFDLGVTYCTHTLSAGKPLAFHQAGSSEIKGHPCYRTFALESYIGAPIRVDRQIFGTINFSASETRSEPFTERDLAFVQLLAQWYGSEVLRERNLKDLQAATAAAETAARSKSEFLANMSHEIRTPMNAVLGLSQLGLNMDETDKKNEFLRKIYQSGQALLTLIDDILDFSKIEAGKLTFERISFELDGVLETVKSFIDLTSEEKGLEVLFSVDANVPKRLIGDPTRLTQVLTNLVSNAVKFTEKGEVIVRLNATDVAKGRIQLSVTVSDTGLGMTSEQIARLFQPFSQADASTTREFGGTGLGLAICRRIIDHLNGEIGVNSEPGVGSTFWFNIEMEIDEDTEEVSADQTSIADLKVLVVDDNAAARDIISSTVSSFGASVETATSGRAALDRLLQSTPQDAAGKAFDVVLIDWRMPDLDGPATIVEARKTISPDRLPSFVLMTTYAQEAVSEKFDHLGISTMLHKPVSEGVLKRALLSAKSPRGSFPDAGKSPSDKEEHKIEKTSLAGLHFLVVEDNEINQQITVGILKVAGATADIAANGKEAVDTVLSNHRKYTAVLMDIQMPVMDGFEATRKIRETYSAAEVPIVALTAHAQAEEIEKCRQAGMEHHISKPINASKLIQTLLGIVSSNKKGLASNSSESEDPAAYLDLEETLDRLGLDRDIYLRLLKTFHDRFANAGAHLDTLIGAGDANQIKDYVHSVKGVAGNIGANRLFQAASSLEHSARSGDLPDADSVLAFKTACEGTLKIIAATLDDPQSDAKSSGEVNPVDTEAFRSAHERLLISLSQKNFGARKIAVDVGKSLNGSFKAEFDRMTEAIEALDFPMAIQHLDSLTTRIESNSG